MTCAFHGCGRPVVSTNSDLCKAHYEQRRRGRALTPVRFRSPNGQRASGLDVTCRAEGCDRAAVAARGYCTSHYRRWQDGELDRPVTNKRRAPADVRFDSKWRLDPETGCHLWTDHLISGYGQFRLRTGKQVLAHKYAYEREHGPVPDGLTLDHICHPIDGSCPGGIGCVHRSCCNPAHLVPTPRGDNARRCVPHHLRGHR